MNLLELQEQINNLVDRFDEETEISPEDVQVRLATQPNYPLQSTFNTITPDRNNGIVYLAEGGNVYDSPYGSDWMWEGLDYFDDQPQDHKDNCEGCHAGHDPEDHDYRPIRCAHCEGILEVDENGHPTDEVGEFWNPDIDSSQIMHASCGLSNGLEVA